MPNADDLVALLLKHLDWAAYPLAKVAEDLSVTSDEAEAMAADARARGLLDPWPGEETCTLPRQTVELSKWEIELQNNGPEEWEIRSADVDGAESATFFLYWARKSDPPHWLPKRLGSRRDLWSRCGIQKMPRKTSKTVFRSDGPCGDEPGWLDRVVDDAPPASRDGEVDDRAVAMLIEMSEYVHPDDPECKKAEANLPNGFSRRLKKLKYNVDDYRPAILQLRDSITVHLVGAGQPGWTQAHERLSDGTTDLGAKCIVCASDPLPTTSCCLGCLQPDLRLLSSPAVLGIEKASRTSVKFGELPALRYIGDVDSTSPVCLHATGARTI